MHEQFTSNNSNPLDGTNTRKTIMYVLAWTVATRLTQSIRIGTVNDLVDLGLAHLEAADGAGLGGGGPHAVQLGLRRPVEGPVAEIFQQDAIAGDVRLNSCQGDGLGFGGKGAAALEEEKSEN